MAPITLRYDEIDALTEQLARSRNNRALAWHIYHLCRTENRTVPAPVAAIVDSFAADISKIAQAALASGPGDNPIRFEPADVARVWRGDGGDNPIGALQIETRNEKAAMMIMSLLELGLPVAAAISSVAKRRWRGLGKDSLWQIWGAFQNPAPQTGTVPSVEMTGGNGLSH